MKFSTYMALIGVASTYSIRQKETGGEEQPLLPRMCRCQPGEEEPRQTGVQQRRWSEKKSDIRIREDPRDIGAPEVEDELTLLQKIAKLCLDQMEKQKETGIQQSDSDTDSPGTDTDSDQDVGGQVESEDEQEGRNVGREEQGEDEEEDAGANAPQLQCKCVWKRPGQGGEQDTGAKDQQGTDSDQDTLDSDNSGAESDVEDTGKEEEETG